MNLNATAIADHIRAVDSSTYEPERNSPVADVISSYTDAAVRHASAALAGDLVFESDEAFRKLAGMLFWDLFVLARRSGYLVRAAASFKRLAEDEPHRVPALLDSLKRGRRADVLIALLGLWEGSLSRTLAGPGER